MLEAHGYAVVAEAATASAALSEAARLHPDIVLLDIGLPDGSGLDLVGQMRKATPNMSVVLISSRRASDFGDRLVASGADGFLDKAALSPQALHDVLSRAAAQ